MCRRDLCEDGGFKGKLIAEKYSMREGGKQHSNEDMSRRWKEGQVTCKEVGERGRLSMAINDD